MKEDLEIAIYIPDIAFTSASAILAEIGDYNQADAGSSRSCHVQNEKYYTENIFSKNKSKKWSKEGSCGFGQETSLHFASFVDL